MPRLIVVALMAGVTSAVFFGFAQQPTKKTSNLQAMTIQPTSPASGSQMYSTYCAVCHGIDGTGTGPDAIVLKTAPTDLTALSRKNGGVFPSEHIYSILKFGTKVPAHGTAEMPIWGGLLKSLSQNSPDSDVVVHQRIVNLTNYLKQMQK